MQFNPWVGKSPWRREKLSTPVFWPGEVRGVFIISSNSIISSIIDTSKLGNKVHRLWKSTELTTSSPLSHACLWLFRKCWREKLIHLRTLSTNPCYLDLWIGSASWLETPGLWVFLFDTELPCIFPILLIFFFWKKNLIEIQLIYNVVLISAVQQSDSVIHIYLFLCSFPLWFIVGYLMQFSILYSRALLFSHSIDNSLHLLIPNIHSIPPPPPLSWQPQICSLCVWICFYFVDSFICVIF